jgi:OOP family OmpA-OmpF porin
MMTLHRLRLAAAIAAALCAPAALAQTAPDASPEPHWFHSNNGRLSASTWYDDRWYVTPLVGYVLTDSARGASDDWAVGLALGKPISARWDLEFRAQWEKLPGEPGGPGNYKNWMLGLDAHWFILGRAGWDRWNTIQPYLIAGAGVINDKNAVKGDSSWMANGGVGVSWAMARWGRIVADARYRYDTNRGQVNRGNSDAFGDWIVSIGLQIPLGPTPELYAPRAARPAAAAPLPVGPAVVTSAAQAQAAGAATATATAVTAPAPLTAAASRTLEISADGMFAFDRAELSAAGRTRIDEALSTLREAGLTRLTAVRIVGHTDPLGSDDYNQRLSQARASAVREYLVARGVQPGVITASGAGESQLKITEAQCQAQGEATPRDRLINCLAPNRRVEITATGQR